MLFRSKQMCWRDWMQNYTYGQTRDRVEYAAVRQRTLSRVPELPTDETMMEAAPGEVRSKAGIAAPAPTSAFAPPPKTLADTPDASAPPNGNGRGGSAAPAPSVVFVAPPGAPAGATASGNAPPPAAECQSECSRGLNACQAKEPKACEKAYKACMRACFK